VGIGQSTHGWSHRPRRACHCQQHRQEARISRARALTMHIPLVLLAPFCPKPTASKKETPLPLSDRTAFRSRIGSLLWLCRGALPIIGYYVAALSRMNHAPGKKH
jgi:hypothetical protein